MKPIIVVAGHVCVDLTPRFSDTPDLSPGNLTGVGPLTITVGGCVANTGGDLVDLGAPVRLVATVGSDELGSIATRALERRGAVRADLQRTDQFATSYSVIAEGPHADRAIWHYPGANEAFDGALVDLDGANLLHFGYPPLMPGVSRDDGKPLATLFTRASRLGLTTSLDMAVVDPVAKWGARDWPAFLATVLPTVGIFSPSYDDLASALGPSKLAPERDLTSEVEVLAERMMTLGAAVVMISAGSHGMFLRVADAKRLERAGAALAPLAAEWADFTGWQHPLPLPNKATTNGAGDAATAGLLHAIWEGLSPGPALSRAALTAAVVITGKLPTTQNLAALAGNQSE
ncbi:PfkB family carbohydrate kinase [Lysinibacter cavernae]|uniref:Sugar/nucleoside kinase (Ribokinase family) n=1 Tax=Lysinibacter cavernae TaxID=1640652 RepID=A0A7X5TTZ1_9MICO|nr:sugar/nucleoside kinase (ribokinase family) [Lysinibacter cavernae]